MNHNILIVDDDQSIRTMLETVLTREGHTVTTAIDGEEGVALAKKESPDLILLDIGLPGIDGIEALTRIKKHDPDVAAIMITAAGAVRCEATTSALLAPV